MILSHELFEHCLESLREEQINDLKRTNNLNHLTIKVTYFNLVEISLFFYHLKKKITSILKALEHKKYRQALIDEQKYIKQIIIILTMAKVIQKQRFSNLVNQPNKTMISNFRFISPAKQTTFHEQLQTNNQYEKTYYCKTRSELDVIKARNNLKNHLLPKFDIVSCSTNFVTVKIKRYSYSGLEQIIRNLEKPQITHNIIVLMLKAIHFLQTYFGSFQLSEQKIKADSAGNIAIWVSQNFQQCFPICPQKIANPIKDEQSFKLKVGNQLERLKLLINRVNQKLSAKIDIKTLNVKFHQIFQKSLLKFFNDIKSQNQKFQLKKAPLSKQKNHFKSQDHLKNLIKSQKYPQPCINSFPSTNSSPLKLSKTTLYSIKSSQMEKQSQNIYQRFSYFQTTKNKNLKFRSPPCFLEKAKSDQEGRLSKLQDKVKLNRLKSPKMQNFPFDLNSKVPSFIKQKVQTKIDLPQPNYRGDQQNQICVKRFHPFMKKIESPKNTQKSQNTDFTLNKAGSKGSFQAQISSIYNFREQVSMEVESGQKQQFLNNLEQDLYPLPNPQYRKSCTQMQNMKLHSNKYLELSMKQSKNKFFMSNLTKKEENQLQQDFEKIFLSRRINNEEEMCENEQLKRQFQLLIE